MVTNRPTKQGNETQIRNIITDEEPLIRDY